MKVIIEFIWLKYYRYKTVTLYLAFGGLTTLVNISVYLGLTKLLGIHYLVSNVSAWIMSVFFAYVTNRIFVFASKTRGLIFISGECLTFFACRMFSGLVDTAIMYGAIELLRLNDILVKIAANILVIILNYSFSKHIVFKDKDQGEVIL